MTLIKMIVTLSFLFIWVTAEEAPLPPSPPHKQEAPLLIQKASFLIAYQITES